ncbi:hypothetical protein ACIQYF_05620 [Pseudomonas sp. NPDC096917]|uniref:hypothetical protein n=1 Tax=Pseudomonas sp. NPDC096917 TaxID=3364483 RepID=UPI00383AFB49
MTLRLNLGSWRRGVSITLLAILLAVILQWITQRFVSEPEIALIYGEPWEDMRQRSSALIPPAIPGRYAFHIPKSDARLRFIDPKYGFVTPQARFFTISFDNERVASIHISPQIEPLLLDDALKVVLDLQNQWREQGWFVINPESDPPLADTPQWRAQLRDINKGGRTFWQAGDKYYIMLDIGRFKDSRHPDEERYLITLEVARPWVIRDE